MGVRVIGVVVRTSGGENGRKRQIGYNYVPRYSGVAKCSKGDEGRLVERFEKLEIKKVIWVVVEGGV